MVEKSGTKKEAEAWIKDSIHEHWEMIQRLKWNLFDVLQSIFGIFYGTCTCMQTSFFFCKLGYGFVLYFFVPPFIEKRLWFGYRRENESKEKENDEERSHFYYCISLWWIFSHGEIALFEKIRGIYDQS